tara:strand:+ start:148 stop:450 length:303 start_codon:yes stop_codon:yes gene_type:complete
MFEAYGEYGITAIVVGLFIMMILNLMKSQRSQNDDLDDIRVHIGKMETKVANSESIVIKLIDRIGRQEETSTRHREDIVKELNDVTDLLSFIRGRLNGKA